MKVLLAILIILMVAVAVYWFSPGLFNDLSPIKTIQQFFSNSEPVAIEVNNQSSQLNTLERENSTPEKTEEEVNEKTPLEKEIEQRQQSYKTKVYTYEPYVPKVKRNPFSRVSKSPYLEEEDDIEMTEDQLTSFIKPELPPDTHYQGIISAGDNVLAVLEIEDETFIAKKNDIILDQYIIKSIFPDSIIIEINGTELELKLGGENATDE